MRPRISVCGFGCLSFAKKNQKTPYFDNIPLPNEYQATSNKCLAVFTISIHETIKNHKQILKVWSGSLDQKKKSPRVSLSCLSKMLQYDIQKNIISLKICLLPNWSIEPLQAPQFPLRPPSSLLGPPVPSEAPSYLWGPQFLLTHVMFQSLFCGAGQFLNRSRKSEVYDSEGCVSEKGKRV